MRSGNRQRAGFTLVELIIVMALLAVVAAVSLPAMGRSMRERNLRDEATRFLAATEYARNEAAAQGVPMIVWIDPAAQRFGVEAKAGFTGDDGRAKTFELNADVRFELDRGTSRGSTVEFVEFSPEGAPAAASADSLKFADRFGAELTVARTTDGWSYEITEAQR